MVTRVVPGEKRRTERSLTARERHVYESVTVGDTTIADGDVLASQREVGAADVEAQYFVGRAAAIIKYNGEYSVRFYATDGSEHGPTKSLSEVNPATDQLIAAFGSAEKPHIT